MGKTIQEAVAEKIANSNETVANTVIDKLAEIEISRRVEILTRAIQKQEPLNKEFKKIEGKDDITTYVGGAEVKAMSKERYEAIQKAKENVEKLQKAIDVALTENTADSYNKLDEILKKLGGAA